MAKGAYHARWGLTQPTVGQIVVNWHSEGSRNRRDGGYRFRLAEPVMIDGKMTFRLANPETGLVSGKRIQAITVKAHYSLEEPPPPPKPAAAAAAKAEPSDLERRWSLAIEDRKEILEAFRRGEAKLDRLVEAVLGLTRAVNDLAYAVIPSSTKPKEEGGV